MRVRRSLFFSGSALLVVPVILAVLLPGGRPAHSPEYPAPPRAYEPRIRQMDTSGFELVSEQLPAWGRSASLEEIADIWRHPGYQLLKSFDARLEAQLPEDDRVKLLIDKATLFNFEGEARRAYQVLSEARATAKRTDRLAREQLFTIIFLQGVTALRIGENDNCVLCRGESSCILPISAAACHKNPEGSRLAIQHFTEYLRQFPDDFEVRWLLCLAHMTLGEYPHKVDPQYVVHIDSYLHSEFDIGKFRDVGHLVGVNRFNHSGGAIMDDFDNDGLLDLIVSCSYPTEPLTFHRNRGNGKFEDVSERAGLRGQLGGLYCVQGDYDNDGWLDIFICRGAWLSHPVRPSLLHNNGDGTFTDVTEKAGLQEPLNSNSAAWADFDNDGFLDLFVCCEKQDNRLYRNKGDGTFEEVGLKAGLPSTRYYCKGAAWIDFDNDDYPDLFLNNLHGDVQLFHNNRDGTFRAVTYVMGLNGPEGGFSCWAWDFDNDGWLDLFATCYAHMLGGVIKGMQDKHAAPQTSKLYRNLGGKGFQDVTKEAGLDLDFACMGSNFGDFDNDGYLDFYLGTGDPSFATLVPNRMFKNVAGRRFAEITSSSGTGHLQKGHAVACGDWDRNGSIDLFVQTAGAVYGDRYHNVLFQNPGQQNSWLTVKLVGRKTNRSAIGARIRVVTAGKEPLSIHRHVSSGSSFGANPLQQTIGLGRAVRVERLEIHWPTSGTTQVFRDVAVNQAIEVTELATDYRKLPWTAVPLPR